MQIGSVAFRRVSVDWKVKSVLSSHSCNVPPEKANIFKFNTSISHRPSIVRTKVPILHPVPWSEKNHKSTPGLKKCRSGSLCAAINHR